MLTQIKLLTIKNLVDSSKLLTLIQTTPWESAQKPGHK